MFVLGNTPTLITEKQPAPQQGYASHLKKMPQKNGQNTAGYQLSFSTRKGGDAGVPGSCHAAISQVLMFRQMKPACWTAHTARQDSSTFHIASIDSG